jgi:hypothetical protein
MSRASARPRNGEARPAGGHRAVKGAAQPRKLTRRDIELPDGRYLLAYGLADTAAPNA